MTPALSEPLAVHPQADDAADSVSEADSITTNSITTNSSTTHRFSTDRDIAGAVALIALADACIGELDGMASACITSDTASIHASSLRIAAALRFVGVPGAAAVVELLAAALDAMRVNAEINNAANTAASAAVTAVTGWLRQTLRTEAAREHSPLPIAASPGDIDRALLEFLRSDSTRTRQQAAAIVTDALGLVAAQQAQPVARVRWRVLQACIGTLRSTGDDELTFAKQRMSAAARQIRQAARQTALHVTDTLLSDAQPSDAPLSEAQLSDALRTLARDARLIPLLQPVADMCGLASPPQTALMDSDAPDDDDAAQYERSLQAVVQATSPDTPSNRSLACPPDALRASVVPMAEGLMPALAQALREQIAAMGREIDAVQPDGASLVAAARLSVCLQPVDAAAHMLDHAPLQHAVAEAMRALADVSGTNTGEAVHTQQPGWLFGFACQLVVLEARIALLPFEPMPTRTGAAEKRDAVAVEGLTATERVAATEGVAVTEGVVATEGVVVTESVAVAEGLAATAMGATAGAAIEGLGAADLNAPNIANTANASAVTSAGSCTPSLQQIFIAEARARVNSLHASLQAWAASPASGLPAQAAIDAHALAGSASTVGWPAMQALAHDLELACDASVHQAYCTDRAVLLKDAISGIAQLLDQGMPGEAPPSAEADAAPVDEELCALFREEADDLLRQLDDAMCAWSAAPDSAELPSQMMRVLHTLKGSARMAGEHRIGDVFHALESQVAGLSDVGPVSGESLLHLQGEVDAVLDIARKHGCDAALDTECDAQCNAAPEARCESDASTSLSASPQPAARLRVPVALVSRLTDAAADMLTGSHQQVDDVLALRLATSELADNLDRLRVQLRELHMEADARIVAHESQPARSSFDPLEFDRYTRVHELARLMVESVADLGALQRTLARQIESLNWSAGQHMRLVRALHADLLQAGTAPFGSIEPRLAQVMRQAMRDLGRDAPQARLLMTGSELAIDRSLLERLIAPLEHLVRNAIAHGIEPPDQRERAGKPRTGTVHLSLSREAGQWLLQLTDDGRGLDMPKLCARAAALRQAENDDGAAAEQVVADDALIFMRGLSTREQLTELAGRGIGMDAVRAAVQALGGAIQVSSEAGQGCSFTLRIPLTLAILPVLLCRAGAHRIGIPSAMVAQVLTSEPPALPLVITDEGKEGYAWQGDVLPLRSLSAMLRVPPERARHRKPQRPTILLLSQAGRRIALLVDKVDARRELSLRDPGPQLSSVSGMIGACPAHDGGIVLVMNPFALDDAGFVSAAAPRQSLAAEQSPAVIWVVDDSLTVRRASQRVLQRAGYHVVLARDGTEALALLADSSVPPPAAMLLDIEMPRMDGFELLAVLRGDARWQTLPVVMITSRTADRHRTRALQLGVHAYVGKPYRDEEMLALLSGVLQSTREVQ